MLPPPKNRVVGGGGSSVTRHSIKQLRRRLALPEVRENTADKVAIDLNLKKDMD